jgi:hypothetical protein
MSHNPTRRGLLLGLGATFAIGGMRAAFADVPGDRRFIVVILRGGLDGLHVVQPYADPDFAALRGPLALPEPGQEGGLLDLGGRFGLHPAMAAFHGMFAGGEAAVLHAVAGPYRSRSHFDAQDLLELGSASRLTTSGWLNRALSAMPEANGLRTGLAVGVNLPLLLRGAAPVGTYAPPSAERVSPDLLDRILSLQAGDPALRSAFEEGCAPAGSSPRRLGSPRAATGRSPPSRASAARPRGCCGARGGRASRCWSSAAGTPIRSRPAAFCRRCAPSMPGSRGCARVWRGTGRGRPCWSSPNSAAPHGPTAAPAPTMARAAPPSWPAARCAAGGW